MRRALLAMLLGACGAEAAWAGPLVVLVRHAEKADASRDPALSAEGRARARALADALRSGAPTHILVSPLRRTGETAAAVAEAAGVEPVVVDLDAGPVSHVKQSVDAVRALPDAAVVLIVGHSNTVPALARALGGYAADMPDCEYDRLTVIDLRPGRSTVTVVSRYGAPSLCPAA